MYFDARKFRPRPALIALAIALPLFTGCGKFFWNKPGADFAQFTADNETCASENAMYANQDRTSGIVNVKLYKACMRLRGWTREQQPEARAEWFRGIENDDAVKLDAPPAQPSPAPAAGASRTGTIRNQTNFGK